MTIIKKVPAEEVYYNWEDEVDLAADLTDDIVILGDRHYVMFGGSTQVNIIKGDYYDDEIGYDYDTVNELNKVIGGDWDKTTFTGYSQGDWVACYYNKEKVSQGLLEEIEAYVMGKVDEFTVQESEDEDDTYTVFIPHRISWDGKEAICNYLNIDPKDAKVYEDDGYTKVYKYKEIE